jgi:p-aminobenzoyl-glutamate transporter AbgT
VVLRALFAAFRATVVLAPLAGFIVAEIGVRELDPLSFLISKVAYGTALSLAVAPFAVLNGRDPVVKLI